MFTIKSTDKLNTYQFQLVSKSLHSNKSKAIKIMIHSYIN